MKEKNLIPIVTIYAKPEISGLETFLKGICLNDEGSENPSKEDLVNKSKESNECADIDIRNAVRDDSKIHDMIKEITSKMTELELSLNDDNHYEQKSGTDIQKIKEYLRENKTFLIGADGSISPGPKNDV